VHKSFAQFLKTGIITIGVTADRETPESLIRESLDNMHRHFLNSYPPEKLIFYYPSELKNVHAVLSDIPKTKKEPLVANFMRHGSSGYYKRNYRLTCSVDFCIIIGYERSDIQKFCQKMGRSCLVVPYADY